MKNNIIKFNLENLFQIIIRAMSIMALFILLLNPIYSQIQKIENKCLWITRDSMVNKNSIESALLFAFESNFDIVFVQIRGRGDAFYDSDIVNKNVNISNTFNPLEYAVKLGHALGLEIHVWINCYIIWSHDKPPLDKDHLFYTNPLWTETDIYGKMDFRIDLAAAKSPSWEGIFLSPMNQEVNQYLREIIKEIYEKYNIDGIHLDYIRYQDEYYGFHPDGRKEFNLIYNIDPLDIARGIISTRYGWDQSYVDSINIEWDYFKQNKITELIQFINEDIDALNKEISISAAVKPNLTDAKYRWHQNWQYWLENDLIDFVVPMNYNAEVKDFIINIETIKNNLNKNLFNRIIIGISTYNQDAESVIDKIFLSRLNGFSRISLFSYDVHKNDLSWFDPILESIKEP